MSHADRWSRWFRLSLLLVCPGILTVASAGNNHDDHVCSVLTIAPFQTATYVDNPEAADLLNNLAEFSTRLLRWKDTARPPVVAADHLVRSGYIPFYRSWRGEEVAAADLSVATIAARVSTGFEALQSPRLVRVSLGETVDATWEQPIEVVEGGESAIPLMVTNRRAATITAILKETNGSGSVGKKLLLGPGQTTGVWLDLPDSISGGEWTFSLELADGSHDVTLPVKHFSSGMLRVRVVDVEGQILPARVYLTAVGRGSYAPKGVMSRIVLADRNQAAPGECYFHTQGVFELTLPAGEARIEVVRGMEYQPVETTVTVAADEVTEVEIKVTRRVHLANEGWFSGDGHVHGNLFAQDTIGPREVLAAAKAEDLNVMNILPCNDPGTTIISDGHYFTGRPDAVSEEFHIVYYNEEMRNDLYGHVGFLNLKTFVEPAYFGWPHSPHPYDFPGNYPQVAAAKAQGALVTYVHPGLPSEFPVDIALGLADMIDVMSQNDERATMPMWYALLNCGFRCPASAGTDSFLNIPYHLVPGAGRVYVKVAGEFTYDNWISAFKAGRTFVTNGPLLRFTFNGADPGEVFSVGPEPMHMTVAGTVDSIVPMSSVEIVMNGEVVRTIAVDQETRSLKVNETLEIHRSSWVAVRTIAAGHRWVTNDRDTFAHTSPVYVEMEGRPIDSEVAAKFFIEHIDALIAKMDEKGVFRDQAQRDVIVKRFREGQKVYENLLSAGK